MAARLWQSQEGSTTGVCDCSTRPASAFGGCGGFKRLRHATDPYSFVRSFARSLAGALVAQIFRRRENFGGAKIFEKKVRVVAIDSVQKSSKSELSSRFLSRLKFENFARHFLVNSADRPRIGANLIMIRPNPGTIG